MTSLRFMLWLSVLLSQTVWAGTPIPLIDAHSHYNDEDAAFFSSAQIIQQLQEQGIERQVITSRPYHLAFDLYEQAPTRILPLMGLYDSVSDKSRWTEDETLLERMRARLQQHPEAVGIGELHLFSGHRHSPVFKALVDLAVERGLMLLMHTDLAVIDQLYEWHPDARVLWAHLGRNPHPAFLHVAMQRYPNLMLDTSVRDQRLVDFGGNLKPEWREFFMRYQDRVVVAVDTYTTSRWQTLPNVTRFIRSWLNQLPPEVASKLAHDNAMRLFD